jgi:hypothetical protein
MGSSMQKREAEASVSGGVRERLHQPLLALRMEEEKR